MYQPILSENNVTKVAEICAWCDSKKIITQNYYNNGWKASHGVCHKHRDEILKETIEYYEKNGFSFSDDDIVPYSDGMQHSTGSAV